MNSALAVSIASLKDLNDDQRTFVFCNGPFPGDMGDVKSFALNFSAIFDCPVAPEAMKLILTRVHHIKRRGGKKRKICNLSKGRRVLGLKNNPPSMIHM